MIVAPDSPLRRLPANLDLKERLYFDGIRYSVEMADVAHLRLRDILQNLSENYLKPGGAQLHRYIAPALLDAWSVIDSVERLRGLIRQAPGFKQKSPGLVVFSQKTADVEALRHAVQHLNHQIDKLLKEGLPVWGVLSWSYATDEPVKNAKCFTLVAGTMFDRQPDMIVNPLGKLVDIPVGLITLKASGHVVCISEIMERVEQLTRKIEAQLSQQFPNLPAAASDMLVSIDIEFGDDQGDVATNGPSADGPA